MRSDIRTLQDRLKDSEMACVPPGVHSITDDVYPAVKSAYPELCDDSLRCDEVCSNGNDQPEWKHAVQRVQQQLARRDGSRVQNHDDHGQWRFEYPNLFLVPVNDEWIDRFDDTVRQPVGPPFGETPPASLEQYLPARVWGTTAGPQKERYFQSMSPGDLVLFYRHSDFFAGGVIGRTLEDPDAGDWLWDNPPSRFVFTVEEYRDWGPDISRVWSALGYAGDPRVQGFLRVKPERVDNLRNTERSLQQFLFGATAATDPEQSDDGSPLDDVDLETYQPDRSTTVQNRILRNRDLADSLKDRYNHECQVCGRRLLSAPGSGYAEVHHIQPLGEPHEGPDTLENMVVLCPNHHVDFDNGMLTVDPETLAIDHAYDPSVSGRQLTVRDNHRLNQAYLRYHNHQIAENGG